MMVLVKEYFPQALVHLHHLDQQVERSTSACWYLQSLCLKNFFCKLSVLHEFHSMHDQVQVTDLYGRNVAESQWGKMKLPCSFEPSLLLGLPFMEQLAVCWSPELTIWGVCFPRMHKTTCAYLQFWDIKTSNYLFIYLLSMIDGQDVGYYDKHHYQCRNKFTTN